MCGIAGIVSENSQKYQKELKQMVDSLSHRGPDDSGIYFFDDCGLGHRRLSIIDLKTGYQPMLSFDNQKAVVFNGEIYGYQEIKKNLSNYPFQTASDTEVILALYEKYGEDFLRHLPGMFAFALWDDKNEKLICARDRFGEWINELPYALEIAKKHKTNHIELTPEKVNLGELLIKMQEIYDEPFADSSNIPTYLLAKTARQYTKVVLTGDGGDEMLGGYGWYKPFLYQEKKLSSPLLRTKFIWLIAKIISKLPVSNRKLLLDKHLGARFHKFNSIVGAHLSQNIIFNDKEIKELGINESEENLYSPSWKPINTLDDAMRLDVENYMPGDILTKIDRASMANSLELRAPFLDVDFASFCLSLPYQLKVTKESDKVILRKVFSDLWTDSVRKRSKQGFGAPVEKWLEEDKSLNNLRENYLNNPQRKIFDIISFRNTREIARGNKYKTWTLLVLSLWMENHDLDF